MNSKAPKEGRQRAAALHKQIAELKSPATPSPPTSESPAAFVHRRMQELAEKRPKKKAQ